MKKIFRKLACCSFLSIVSIGCFDSEARVTKEVAEATLPYLMEAAGIPGDPDEAGVASAKEAKYKNVKIKAILDMIYTDEGQQQMVNWVKNGEFPQKLKDAGFESVGTYKLEKYRKITLASLFPCQTGTLTSFANHKSRLGFHVLSETNKLEDNLISFLNTKKFNVPKTTTTDCFADANISFHKCNSNVKGQYNLSIDTLLAKIIFIIDIYDENTIAEVLNQFSEFDEDILDKCSNLQEYTVRPVSAIVAINDIIDKDEGDCVETVYHHLINIAIQDPEFSRRNRFHIERLPIDLRRYYDPEDKYFNEIKPNIKIAQGFLLFSSEAGITGIQSHRTWKQCLKNSLKSLLTLKSTSDFYNQIILSKETLDLCVSIGSINYIANILHAIAFHNSRDNNMPVYSGDGNKTNAILIENAMNKLAALSAGSDKRFHVCIENKQAEEHLKWANHTIQISDFHAKRKITIYVQTNGHAEIAKIEQFHV